MPRTPRPAPPPLLVVVRHGDAGDALAAADRDALRPLTPKGRKQSKRAGRALARLGLVPSDVWTSRLPRAVETAALALRATGAAEGVRTTPSATLAPDAAPERILRALADTPPLAAPRPRPHGHRPHGRATPKPATTPVIRWVVGHEPHLSRLLAHLIGASAAALDVGKGAVAVVEGDGRGWVAGGCRLRLLVGAEGLRSLRE